MALTLRTTGLSPPAYQHQKDYTVFQDSRPIGRLYEDLAAGTRNELRWFWSITVVVDARSGVRTDGRTASFEEAKAHPKWLSVPKIRFDNNGDEVRRGRTRMRCGPRAGWRDGLERPC